MNSKHRKSSETPPSVEKNLETNRQSWKSIGDKSRELKEQLLRLEEKLWGRKADETVGA